MRGQIPSIIEHARETGRIEFGGEYVILATDDQATALDKLRETGYQIGGIVRRNGSDIDVFPAYSAGYWSICWLDPKKGPSGIAYWTSEDGRFVTTNKPENRKT